ncbi:MAG TPA: hypothetical protein DEB24_06280 [Coriobacteriia bacterium]|nr:hypothetical protein [Coriobacteriia bacterium]
MLDQAQTFSACEILIKYSNAQKMGQERSELFLGEKERLRSVILKSGSPGFQNFSAADCDVAK